MSTAEATAVPPAGAADQPARSPAAFAAWLRLLRSELRLVFRRLRNLALLALLAALPVLLGIALRSEEHTSELQSLAYLVCRLLLEKKKNTHSPVLLPVSTITFRPRAVKNDHSIRR